MTVSRTSDVTSTAALPLQETGNTTSSTPPTSCHIKQGDTLMEIAEECYGDANAFMAIWEANPGKIIDPDLIYAGDTITLPSQEEALTLLQDKKKTTQLYSKYLEADINRCEYTPGYQGERLPEEETLALIENIQAHDPLYQNVSLAEMLALIQQESGFNARAVSSAYCLGLTQVAPATAHRMVTRLQARGRLPQDYQFKGKDLFHPEFAILIGFEYLSYIREKYGGNQVAMYAGYFNGDASRFLRDDMTTYDIPLATNPKTRRYVEEMLEKVARYNRKLEERSTLSLARRNAQEKSQLRTFST